MTPTITIPRAIVEQALEALRELLPDERDPNCDGYDARDVRQWRATAAALRTALAQQQAEPVQEPVAWMVEGALYASKEVAQKMGGNAYTLQALYTAPQQAEPVQPVACRNTFGCRCPKHFAAQQAEPVAWMESPYGVIRANPAYKIKFPSQLLHWQIPLFIAPQQAEPVELVAFDTAHAMRLADEYADLAADVRAAQGYPEHALAQDRKRMDEARASLEAYLSRQAEPVQIEHLPDGLAGWIPRYSVETPKGWVASYNKEALAWLAGSNYQDGQLTLAQQAEPCDMGQMCLNCQPRGPNGECPDKQAEAVQRKPLTEEELQKVLYSVATSIDAPSVVMTHWPLVARAVEARLAEPVQRNHYRNLWPERNFCSRCGKRLADEGIHTCTPPQTKCSHCASPLFAALECRVCGRKEAK